MRCNAKQSTDVAAIRRNKEFCHKRLGVRLINELDYGQVLGVHSYEPSLGMWLKQEH
jgi:hypothetical protein